MYSRCSSKCSGKKVWLLFAYMIRGCILPQKEFQQVSLQDLQSYCELFYRLYEKVYGANNCTYNTHIVGSHLIEMRHHGPLTLTSAFSFESFYGEIRQSFVPGTQSTLKQIFKKILIKRALQYHCCEKNIYYSDHNTCLENNTLIYCYRDLSHRIFKIKEVHEDHLLCFKVGKKRMFSPKLQTLILVKLVCTNEA